VSVMRGYPCAKCRGYFPRKCAYGTRCKFGTHARYRSGLQTQNVGIDLIELNPATIPATKQVACCSMHDALFRQRTQLRFAIGYLWFFGRGNPKVKANQLDAIKNPTRACANQTIKNLNSHATEIEVPRPS